ncbi:hypothetical protein EMIT0P100_70111 [Pseudomonas sp. IT-P100]
MNTLFAYSQELNRIERGLYASAPHRKILHTTSLVLFILQPSRQVHDWRGAIIFGISNRECCYANTRVFSYKWKPARNDYCRNIYSGVGW